MSKTIKEIADELGVSKTAVRKKIANLGLQSGLRKNGNQFAIEKGQGKGEKTSPFLRGQKCAINCIDNISPPIA